MTGRAGALGDGRYGMRGRCAERDGFTLLEVVIALALLVAVSAVTLPMLFGRSGRTAWGEARARIESGVHLAQANARLEGRPFRVEADPGDPCVLRLAPVPEVDASEWGAGAEASSGERRFLAALPEACELSAGSETDGDAEGASAPKAADGAVLIGWVLPDGGFVQAPDARLTLDERTATVTIERWTGRVTLEEGETTSVAAGPAVPWREAQP